MHKLVTNSVHGNLAENNVQDNLNPIKMAEDSGANLQMIGNEHSAVV